jgi:uncharacterized membrane protein
MSWMKTSLLLIFIGIVLLFIAILLLVVLLVVSGSISGVNVGGCIVVLFIPICFGYGEPSLLISLMAISVILVIALLFLEYLMFKDVRRDLGSLKKYTVSLS